MPKRKVNEVRWFAGIITIIISIVMILLGINELIF